MDAFDPYSDFHSFRVVGSQHSSGKSKSPCAKEWLSAWFWRSLWTLKSHKILLLYSLDWMVKDICTILIGSQFLPNLLSYFFECYFPTFDLYCIIIIFDYVVVVHWRNHWKFCSWSMMPKRLLTTEERFGESSQCKWSPLVLASFTPLFSVF